MLDDQVISAPVIREPILGGTGQISGNFTVDGANDLAILLRAGALPLKPTFVEERTVGPSLGADSIAAGEIAGIAGLAGAGRTELLEAVFGYIVDSVGRADGADFPSLDPSMRNIGLFDMGFDSVQLVRLQMRLQKHLGITLESTCIIDHPKVNLLLGEVNRALEADTGTEVPTAETRSVNRGHRPAPSRTEPIAVVGMSFRLPGDIRTLKQLWTVLDEGIDVVGPVPPARWAHSGLDTGEITTTEGGYLSDVEEFDAGFFNISPVEAVHIDPQQRLLLELTWEAFEDAGMDPRAVGADQRVGVFVAIYNNDYRQVGRDFGHTHDAYAYTGNMANAAAGRISYTFGFRGPSMAIDTACSSSLYALHLACQELRSGSCDVVVTAGVNLILSPEGHLSWSRLGALAPSGRCRSFDEHADGYIRSEGGVVVVLKRLSDAERDGDTVFAVLKGSAVSHNGTSGGFTVPNGRAQTQVVRDAMEAAGVGVEDVSYIEAHGSGTPIGDPQELNALARVFEGRTDKVVVGSVKSNIGHLESAAGMAALCKVILCLQQGRLPGTLHFTRGNPLVDWESAPFEVSADGTTWDVPGLRRAGISSFGISGTNAHLIVEEYPTADRSTAAAASERPHLLAVSAHSRPLLGKALADLAAWGGSTSAGLRDVAFTLGRRAHLEHRHAILCDSVSDIAAAVAAADVDAVPPATSDPVFVFAGQGTTYPGMARELFDRSELFRSELEGLDAAFRAAGDINLLEVMFRGDEEAFRSPLYTQPLIFAVELALARYWESLGVRPVAVVGHSIGEYAAACFAGVLDRDAAVELVMRRAEVIGAALQAGALAVVGVLVAFKAVHNLLAPPPVEASGMLVMGVIGLAANVLALLVLSGGRGHDGHGENLNMRAAFLEVVNDALGSVGVIVAAAVVVAVSWWANPEAKVALAHLGTWFLLFGAPRAVVELQSVRRRGRGHESDADQLARLTRIPGGLWVALFAIVTGGGAALGVLLLVGRAGLAPL